MLRIANRLVVAVVLISFFGCENKDQPLAFPAVDCSKSTLAITVAGTSDATSCNLIDGTITVNASGGTSPYSYSLDGGSFQTSNTFRNLAPGLYHIMVQDASLCSRIIQVDLSAAGSTLDASYTTVADADCLTGKGSVIVTATGGTGPYIYQFGTGDFSPDNNQQDSLETGFYTITVKDANNCPKVVSVLIPRGNTGVSYATDIKPIVDTSCAIQGCHNGNNGPTRNWTDFSLFQKNAQNIKTRTGNRSMPLTGSLTDDQIKLIACWVDDGANNN